MHCTSIHYSYFKATRLEYERRKAQEAQQRAEQRRIKHPNSETGEEEYVIDEVGKQEDDKNDYLEHSGEKPDSTPHKVARPDTTHHQVAKPGNISRQKQNRRKFPSSPKVIENSSTLDASKASKNSPNTQKITPPLNPTSKFKSDTINLAPGRISGVASISPTGTLYVDRTVELKLDVEDLRRR
ncbi:hypothetical protein OESDEN_14239 [Oesophagostomum dentatum]|uniref:Uncharacterized protein n=1 Tax=Oesophagostomum dentatum TaxID=61180 RepID=A0A0B1SL14_OESDE|nr:hypothetical protein OESDEN_14239 [Oesophagostomum dentatum]